MAQANDKKNFQTLGNDFHKKGEYQNAIEQYTLGISADPSNHVLFSNRSASNAKLEQYEEALNDANQAIELKPDFAKGYSRKGSALQFLGRTLEAKYAFEKGLELDPENEIMQKGLKECEAEIDGPPSIDPIANPFANVETILPRLREDEKTSKFVEDESFMEMLKDLGQNPLHMQKYLKDDRLRLTLSALLGFELEHPDKMNFNEPPFVDYDDDDSKSTEVKNKLQATREAKKRATEEKNVGLDYFGKQNYEKAIEHYNRAIEHDSSDITLYSEKATAYLKQGLNQQVRETSLSLVDVWKKSGGERKIAAKAYQRIGQTYLEEEDFAKAEENFEHALKVYSSRELKKLIEECRTKMES